MVELSVITKFKEIRKLREIIFWSSIRGSIEKNSVKPKQTAENNLAYKIYLLKEVQCLGHENELRNLGQIYIHIYIYIYIYT
jgi:hypothetical protein